MSAAVWTDRDGAVRDVPEPPPEGSCYGPIGDFQGAAYERNAFAQGTEQEAAFLVEALDLSPGMRVVDVGCGTGRHARALTAYGVDVVGVDVSEGLLAVAARARPGGWVRADARALPFVSGCADSVLCLCQGGFGITPGGDQRVLGEIARILRPGGRLALTAFSTWFAARFLVPEDAVDVARDLVHNDAEVRNPDGEAWHVDLWTTCYTAPQLALLVEAVGLELEDISGVEPGAYRLAPPQIADPELLLRAHKPHR